MIRFQSESKYNLLSKTFTENGTHFSTIFKDFSVVSLPGQQR